MRLFGLAFVLGMSGLPVLFATITGDDLPFYIPTVTRAPELSEFLDGARPQSIPGIDDFRQRQPTDGAPGTLGTTAYLAYGEAAVYVVFVCKDDPAKVRAHLSRRESISGDDIVGVSIDTFHDGRRAYMFYANPLGVQLDGISTEGQSDDYKFDTIWSADGRLTRDGYIVRFTIPYKSMRARMGPGRTWGVALTRHIPRNDEYDTWPRITDKIEAFVPQFALANAPSQAAQGHNILLNPYGFFANQRVFDDAVPAIRQASELRGGMDAKIVLRDAITLDLTANPDFSQVESDEPQLTANRRYEVYFPEKRPFFLENASYFQTPEALFFSRRILDPEFGVRATGKFGRWTFGALAMDDRAPLRTGESDTRAQIGVVRVQREFGRESNLGFLATSRQTSAGTNTVAGLDLRWKLSPHWVLTAQAAASAVTHNGITPVKGSDVFGEIRYVGHHLTYSTTYRERSANLTADLGFIPRTDIRQSGTDVAYRWRPEAGAVTSFGPSAYALVTYDHAGKLQDWSLEVPFTINFRGPSSLSFGHTAGSEVFGGRAFRRDGDRAVISTDYWKRVGVTASFARERAINYYPAADNEPSGVAATDARFEATFHFSPRVRLDETYFYSRLSAGGRAVLDDHIARSKLNVQFTRAVSLRVILDYNATLANTQMVDLDRSKRLTGDILLTYLIHPGTALYVGYNDRRENWLWPDGPAGPALRGGPPAFPSGRQVFVKFSYVFHL